MIGETTLAVCSAATTAVWELRGMSSDVQDETGGESRLTNSVPRSGSLQTGRVDQSLRGSVSAILKVMVD